MANPSDQNLSCSFCKKNQDQIRHLVAGPNVYICDECVEVCVDIISDAAAPVPPSASPEDEAGQRKSPLLAARCSLCHMPTVVEELVALLGRGAICQGCIGAVREATAPEDDAERPLE